jgi:branched-chain amino acid transport system substrate-binding protein
MNTLKIRRIFSNLLSIGLLTSLFFSGPTVSARPVALNDSQGKTVSASVLTSFGNSLGNRRSNEVTVLPGGIPESGSAVILEPFRVFLPLTFNISISACAIDSYGCAVFSPGQIIKIGMGAPMTGDNAFFGQDISQAAMLAVSDAGLFMGFTFELVAEDDGGSPSGGAVVANTFVTDPQVVAIAGHIFSGATMSAMPIYEAASIPMMSPSATNPILTTSGSKVFNRCVFITVTQGKFAAAYLYNKLKFTKLAILHDGQAYGQGVAQAVNDEFTGLGGTVVAFQAIAPGESDYSAVLADISSKEPEALYYGGYTAEAVVIVNQMKSSGLEGVTFFGDDGTYGQNFLDLTGVNGEGAYSTSLLPRASEAKAKFDAAFLATYGRPAGTLSPYTWTGYDSAAVLVKAIESVAMRGGDGRLYIPRSALVTAVRATKDYQGTSGMITCDPTGECASGPTFVIDVGGKWVEVP